MAKGSYIDQTPINIPSCRVWLDATDTSTITSSSNLVSIWRDKSGNKNNATQGTTANQPSTGVATINGLNAIQFDNDNNRFLNTGLAGQIPNCSIFIVAQQVVSTAQGLIFSGGSSSQTMRMTSNNLGFSSNDAINFASISAGASVLTAPAIFGIVANASTLVRYLYKNSIAEGISGTYRGLLGSSYFGSNSNTSGSARGGYKQGEAIIYDRVLTADEITKVIQYLSNKWGIILT